MKKLLISLAVISASIMSVNASAKHVTEHVKYRWHHGVHERIIVKNVCKHHYHQCKKVKRTQYLNRNWPDKVVVIK